MLVARQFTLLLFFVKNLLLLSRSPQYLVNIHPRVALERLILPAQGERTTPAFDPVVGSGCRVSVSVQQDSAIAIRPDTPDDWEHA